MTAREALVERAKKATEASRYQVHAYVGANDYLYERVRNGRPGRPLQSLQNKFNQLTDDGVQPLRRALGSYTPSKVRETVQDRAESARERRSELASRGAVIVSDWHRALAVQDANSLIKTVRAADDPADLAKSIKNWIAEFPPAATPAGKPTRKPAVKSVAKPVAKSVAKPAVKSVAKPAVKSVAKPAVKSVAKPVAKPEAATTARKTATRKTARKSAAKRPAVVRPIGATPAVPAPAPSAGPVSPPAAPTA